MASVEVSSLSKAEHDELCCSYAALLLSDEGLELSAEKLQKVITASGNTVEPYWPKVFASVASGLNISDLLTNIGSAAPAVGGGAAPVAAAGGDAAAPVKKEEEVKKDEPEDVDMGGLFGGDDDY